MWHHHILKTLSSTLRRSRNEFYRGNYKARHLDSDQRYSAVVQVWYCSLGEYSRIRIWRIGTVWVSMIRVCCERCSCLSLELWLVLPLALVFVWSLWGLSLAGGAALHFPWAVCYKPCAESGHSALTHITLTLTSGQCTFQHLSLHMFTLERRFHVRAGRYDLKSISA